MVLSLESSISSHPTHLRLPAPHWPLVPETKPTHYLKSGPSSACPTIRRGITCQLAKLRIPYEAS